VDLAHPPQALPASVAADGLDEPFQPFRGDLVGDVVAGVPSRTEYLNV
jgi:hypothetical protein